jgi:hypothetical protein
VYKGGVTVFPQEKVTAKVRRGTEGIYREVGQVTQVNGIVQQHGVASWFYRIRQEPLPKTLSPCPAAFRCEHGRLQVGIVA